MPRELRGDIQGLRAVAVLTVIGAHAGATFLPGGFIGVDVFYVISGYLISRLLYREVLLSGRLSLSRFWARRARRILPAATVVTLATVVCSLLWFSLVDARRVVVDALWASVFAANVNVAQQGVSYFAQDSGPSPLQHYWSLAVEEQFYVVWPLLLLGCLLLHRVVRRHRTEQPRLPRRTLFLLLLAVAVASFTWSVVQSAAQPESAYFSTLTRTWELAVGAMIALVPPGTTRRLGARTASLLATVGLVAVAAAAVLYSERVAFPGYAAALPVAGTAMLLLAGSSRTPTGAARLLSTRVLRTVGDWSYSLYLWHWPVLVLGEHAVGRDLGVLERVLAVALVFGLSALTYRLVEVPVRDGRPARTLRQRRALLLYPVCLALVATTTGSAWLWTGYRGAESGDDPAITVEGNPQPSTEALVQASVQAARDQRQVPSNLTPDVLALRDSIADVGRCDYTDDLRRLCPRGDVDGDRTMVLIGDSHARAWIPAFDRIAVAEGWRTFYLVKPQCVAAHVSVATIDDARPFTECAAFQDWSVDQVRALDPDLVVVASSPPVNGVLEGTRRVTTVEGVVPLLAQGYDDLFTTLSAGAADVVLLRDVPKSGSDPATCLTTGSPDMGTCMFQPEERSRVLGDVAVDSARAAGARVVDPTPWLCYQDECPVVIGGTLSYRDADHLTTEYAATLSDSLGRALEMTAGD
ncbi:MAG: acyltransferase [Nocardioides sp.]|nr:acyltransferase [Nocardioides sp.]